MRKNSLIKCGDSIFRILDSKDGKVCVIDCVRLTMPKWMATDELYSARGKALEAGSEDTENERTEAKRSGLEASETGALEAGVSGADSSENPLWQEIPESELLARTKVFLPDLETLDTRSTCIMSQRFAVIAEILPVATDFHRRNQLMEQAAKAYGVSRQTVRNYLCLYLAYQSKAVLAPKPALSDTTLTQDEKNMRWALNRFFYSTKKNSLPTAYTMLLKEKYCDGSGVLLAERPSYYQFRYFYRKTRKMQNYYISRNGLKHYQRNQRPLLGTVQEYATNVGVGMLDATILDIYLVNEAGALTGRPILTACIDAYSGLCCGYFLSWEGGVYSVRGLMLNVIADKVELCRKHGISIRQEDWNCTQIPGTLMTDRGSEYISANIEQITELGVKIVNLPSFRAEQKSPVEKFFDLIQDSYKPHLKGKGVIEPDFQERGVHDYRKDACLTMAQFETILLRCIIYYNSQRLVENFPYTAEMVQENVQPYASSLWNYGLTQPGANLLSVSAEKLTLNLLPRAIAKFSRYGLRVNGLRYRHPNYAEKYLSGGSVTVAYNPDDVSYVWLLEGGAYVRFELIEGQYRNLSRKSTESLKQAQKKLVQEERGANAQARIDLAGHIETIAKQASGVVSGAIDAEAGNGAMKANVRNGTMRTDTGNGAMKVDAGSCTMEVDNGYAAMAANAGIRDVRIKGVRDTRKKEGRKTHVDYVEEYCHA